MTLECGGPPHAIRRNIVLRVTQVRGATGASAAVQCRGQGLSACLWRGAMLCVLQSGCSHQTALPPAANPEPAACARWELIVTNLSRDTPRVEWWGWDGSKTSLGVASHGTRTVVLTASSVGWPGTVRFTTDEGPTSPSNGVVRVPTYKVRCLDAELNRSSRHAAWSSEIRNRGSS